MPGESGDWLRIIGTAQASLKWYRRGEKSLVFGVGMGAGSLLGLSVSALVALFTIPGFMAVFAPTLTSTLAMAGGLLATHLWRRGQRASGDPIVREVLSDALFDDEIARIKSLNVAQEVKSQLIVEAYKRWREQRSGVLVGTESWDGKVLHLSNADPNQQSVSFGPGPPVRLRLPEQLLEQGSQDGD